MFTDELLEYCRRVNYSGISEVVATWMQPPIIYQPVEEFGDQN